MGLSLAMMGLIVLINLIVIGLVMYIGAQHDPHTSVRSVESSKAAQLVNTQAEKAAAKMSQMTVGGGGGTTGSTGETTEDAVSGQLGDEEARAKRREAALARKAARASTPVAKE